MSEDKNTEFDFSFKNRSNDNMLKDLGVSIRKIAKVTPGGILVFFPSYVLMNKCYELWEEEGVLSKIN